MSRLKNLTSYACYYGLGRLADLKHFELVILQPGHYTAADLDSLHTSGTTALAYLSLGEDSVLAPDASWYLRSSNGAPLENLDWNTYYIDTRDIAWQEYLLSTLIPPMLQERQFDGLFLDGVDTPDLFPEIRDSMIALVGAIRAAYPATILVVNRGFTILEQIVAYVDGVMFECFSTCHRAGHYATWSSPIREYNSRLADWLNQLRLSHPIKILSLDYALPTEKPRIEYATRRALAYGFIPYVCTWDLGEIFFLDGVKRKT